MLSLTLLLTTLLTGENDPVVRVIPNEVNLKTGHMKILKAETNGKVLRWVLLKPDNSDSDFVQLTEDGKTAVFVGRTNGTYRVVVYTALADVPSEPTVVVIKVGDEVKPPGPTPPNPNPPDPNPPKPNNPLTEKFQREFDKDQSTKEDKAKWKGLIVGLFEGLAEHVEKKNVNNIGDLFSDYEAARSSLLPSGVLRELREALGLEVFNLTGDDTTKVIDAELKSKLVNGFKNIATALKGVK